MDIQFTKQKSNLTLTILLLMIALSACRAAPTSNSSFEYQVHVQAASTGTDLPDAQVRIEITGIAPLTSYTDANGTARIFIESSIEGKPAILTVELLGFTKYVKNIDLRKEFLPTTIQLEQSLVAAPTPQPSPTSVGSTPVPDPSTCQWIPYLNGEPSQELNDQNCLNDLMGIGISGDSQQISFFVSGQPSGIYGVCRDISNIGDFKLHVDVKNNINAVRFFIAFGPGTIPNQSTHALRIQSLTVSAQQKEMYIKFIAYNSEGFSEELAETNASQNWEISNKWNFDFVFNFNGAKASAQINQMPSPYTWSMDPDSRYLCLAYEAIPAAGQSAQLEAHISFP
ncbi:MAG TPA: hypothetical protein PK414_14370 [Anaerolineales bacterium]|nr:hypothetical protein [Anaerolineales bacterium]HNC31580.1 hypothetical protein [Cyclobacteriaceae bacterium]